MGKLYLGSTEITPSDTKLVTTYTAGDGIKITNDEISVDQRVVALKTELPTKVSQLTNDRKYQTETEVNEKLELKQDVLTVGDNITIEDNTISAVDTVYTAGDGIEIDENNVIKNTRTSAAWGNITGTLSSQTDLNEALAAKQGTLTAGDNISIENGTISATDTTYTAGTGIDITDGVISSTATSAVWGNITGTLSSQTDLNTALGNKQDKLTAGNNITIENGVISAADSNTYTNGDGLSLTGNVFAVDSTIARTEALTTGLAGKQDTITDLADIRSNATAGKSASDTIATYGDIVTHNTAEFASSDLVPTQASSTNQLADKDFVNSSVATNTAYFKGTYDTLEELQAVENPTNNDYGFVRETDSSGNPMFNRYKYNGADSEWVFEYSLNNSSFTEAQWSAIGSGITADKVSTYDEYASQIAGKQDTISDLETIRTGAGLGATALQSFTETDPTVPSCVKSITEADITSWNSKSTFSGDYNDLTNKPTIPTVPTNVSAFTNDAGYITGISSSDVTTALGYTPYNSTNPNGYITSSYHDSTKQNTLTAGTNITIDENNVISASTGTVDYTELTNKPKINNVELTGEKSLADLGIQPTGDYALKSELFSKDYNDLTNKPSIPSKTSDLTNDSNFIDNTYHDDTKQDTLVSGTSIKTINNESILGEGNITISGADLINDTTASTDKVYSSSKVENLLSNTIVWKQW